MMTKNRMLKLSLTALVLAGATATGVATHNLSFSAFAAEGLSAKTAASEAKAARKAMAKRQAGPAVAHAEKAVANDPTNADYRALLGQAYLLAGRFTSAGQALTDAITLNPADGRVALNLALAKVAQGDWAGARETLQANADRIPASDRGLAFALAGDPVTGVAILEPAAREQGATAKTRQNLALSYALSGRWREASQVAAMDVAPAQLQARLLEWTQFARPTNAYDQVAALLNVRPTEDSGQPVALALTQQRGIAVAAAAPVAEPDPIDAHMPGNGAVAQPAPVAVAATSPAEAPAESQQIAGTGPQVVFGARAEIVQASPVRTARAATPMSLSARPSQAEAAMPASRAKGDYYVQLGAYENAAVARDAWHRHLRRVAALNGAVPQGARITTGAGSFYRLSVGGYARRDADGLCRQVKASGGACFVRTEARDAVAEWVSKRGTQLASR